MTRVMAQGTFDLLHPGHLHYLRESAAQGDELYVVIARDSRMQEKKPLVLGESSRRELVDALEMVDNAVLGSEDSIFDSVERIQPDVITLGYDQPFEVGELEESLAEQGFDDITVTRIDAYEGDVSSSTDIRRRINTLDTEE